MDKLSILVAYRVFEMVCGITIGIFLVVLVNAEACKYRGKIKNRILAVKFLRQNYCNNLYAYRCILCTKIITITGFQNYSLNNLIIWNFSNP